MSLSPIWYSTLFGAYFFAGAYWSALAAMGLVASWRVDARRPVLHDLGKLVFAFSIFWAYLLWSQYLPIWYAGLPEETFFVVPRVHRLPWGALGWTALVLIWVVPFVALMGRKGKRTPAILGTVCAAGLVGMWIERYVLIVPSLSPASVPFGWVEASITARLPGRIRALCASRSASRPGAGAQGGRVSGRLPMGSGAAGAGRMRPARWLSRCSRWRAATGSSRR